MSLLRLPPRLVIAEALAFRDLLIEHLAGTAGEVQLDGSAVEELDTAGMQLLLAAAHTANASHRALRLVGCSPAMRRILELTGVASRLGVAAASGSEDLA